MLTKKEKIGGFNNEHGEVFEIYKGKQRDNFYISGDKLTWTMYKLVIVSSAMFTAVGPTSYGFWFDENEMKKIAKIMEEYLSPRKLEKVR